MVLEVIKSIDMNFFLLVLAGSAAGLIVGAIPGLSVTMATALLVSITFGWPMKAALAVIMGVYVSGVFGGAISAILINIPGAPASVATTLDGFPMAQKGEASKALWAATGQSFIGTIIGILVLMFVAKPVTAIALSFSPMDYFLLAVFGLTTVGSLTSKDFTKGLVSATIGLIISMAGTDPIMGTPRLTFGYSQLMGGISLISVLIGLFGFTEVLDQIAQRNLKSIAATAGGMKVDIKETIRHLPLAIRAAFIGVFVGALPGVGGPVASLLAYDHAKKTVKKPSKPFGEGAVEGIVASEAANNACIGGALIPMLTLAVPGDAVTAVILSAFYVHGLRPGPLIFFETPELFYVILAGGFVGAAVMLLLGIAFTPILCKVVLVPKRILLPIVSVLCVIGSFAVNLSMFDVLVMMIMGIIGYLMRLRGYSAAPMVLGVVLGPLMDANFRRAASLASSADNVFKALFVHPITIVLLIMVIVSVVSGSKALQGLFLKKRNS